MATARQRRSLADRLLDNNGNGPGATGDFYDDYFEEEPVPLDVFIHDRRYMNQPDLVLGEHQYNLIRHMEQVYAPWIYPHMVREFGEYWEPVRQVNLLMIEWGKGAGKDLTVQNAIARISYLLLCLKSPQQHFDLAAQSDIHLLNIAMNAAQAHRAFFKPLSTAIKASPWFQDKIRSEITDQAKSIRLEKQIELISGHSQVENFEGLSPIAVVLDEISGFQSDEQKASRGVVESQRTAEHVYKIVRTSAATRFPDSYKVAAISYPRYLHDPIQNLVAVGNKDIEERGLENSRYYVDGPRATWEVNPRYRNVTFLDIPQTTIPVPEALVADYEDDAVDARSKYECRPERAANRYIRNDSAIAAAFPKPQTEDWIPPVQIDYFWGIDREGAKAEDSYELAVKPGWNAIFDISPDLVPMEGAIYALHADLAISGDRAGIAMCHVKNWERRTHLAPGQENKEKKHYVEDDKPIIKVDFVTCFESDLEAVNEDGELQPREVQIRWFRALIRELRRRGFVIGLVTFDNFQSTDSIQILEMWGIPSDKLSVDRNAVPYATLRDVMYDGRLEGYHHQLLIDEIEGLNKLPNGKIDHPPGGSKDLADALCGAVTNALELGGDEGEKPEQIDPTIGPELDVQTNLGATDSFWGTTNYKLDRESFFM